MLKPLISCPVGMSYTDRMSVYNGTKTRTSDYNTAPFTSYQYMVMSINSVGGTESEWMSVSTKEAPPTGFSAPVVLVSLTKYLIYIIDDLCR